MLRAAKLDIVGVVTLGMITALGGGIVRDVLIGYLPPATFSDWRYLAVAAGGGLVAFVLGQRLDRLVRPITVLDAVGLSLFAVTGASKALELSVLRRTEYLTRRSSPHTADREPSCYVLPGGLHGHQPNRARQTAMRSWTCSAGLIPSR